MKKRSKAVMDAIRALWARLRPSFREKVPLEYGGLEGRRVYFAVGCSQLEEGVIEHHVRGDKTVYLFTLPTSRSPLGVDLRSGFVREWWVRQGAQDLYGNWHESPAAGFFGCWNGVSRTATLEEIQRPVSWKAQHWGL